MTIKRHEIKPSLAGISETMLWTLYNRASDCTLPNALLTDPDCLEIYNSLDYDFEKSFGKPDYGHAFRSYAFDCEISKFLEKHPNGLIINLGEGLETQRFRLNHFPQSLWVSIDVPDGIAIREQFIQPDEQHLHIGKSALDFSWADDLPTDRPVFITAQGLLMYFPEEEVKNLFKFLVQRFPGSYFMFDTLPRMMSEKSMSKEGWYKTPKYRCPQMPWGINRPEVKAFIENCVGSLPEFKSIFYTMPHGKYRLFNVLKYIPFIANCAPVIVTFKFPESK